MLPQQKTTEKTRTKVQLPKENQILNLTLVLLGQVLYLVDL